MYKISYIKQVCETIYGRDIPDRTWLRWKSKLSLEKHIRFCPQGQMEQLLTLANLRREKPLSQLSLSAVLNAKTEALMNLQRQVNIPIIPTNCLGKDLPQIIKECTGKTVSTKSLYRWAKTFDIHFGTNRNYAKSEIEMWISVAYKI